MKNYFKQTKAVPVDRVGESGVVRVQLRPVGQDLVGESKWNKDDHRPVNGFTKTRKHRNKKFTKHGREKLNFTSFL